MTSSFAERASRIVPTAVSFNEFCSAFKPNVEILDVVPQGLYSTSIVCKAVTAEYDVAVELELDVNYEYIRRAATTLKLLAENDRARKVTAAPVFVNFCSISRQSIKNEAQVPLLREASGVAPRNKIPAVGSTDVNLKRLLRTHSVNGRFGLYILITEYQNSKTVEDALHILDDDPIMVYTNARNLFKFIEQAFKQVQLLQEHKITHNALLCEKTSTATILAGSTRGSPIVSYNSVDVAAEKSTRINLRQIESFFSYRVLFFNFRYACSHDSGLLPYKCEHGSEGQDAVDIATIMNVLLQREQPQLWEIMRAPLMKIIDEAETPASIERYIADIDAAYKKVEMDRERARGGNVQKQFEL